MTQPAQVIINDIADLYRLLDQSPQWEEAIRNRLLGERLLSVPDRLDQQTQELRELREITANLAETAAENTRQLVELRATAEEHTRQLTELTAQVKELRVTAEEHTRQLVELRRTAESNTEAIREFDAKVSRLDRSRGSLYEWKVNHNIGALLGERLDLIDFVTYHESGRTMAKEMNDTIKAAARAGIITPSQMHRLAAADLLCRAVNFYTDAPTVIVGEVALNLDQEDLERVVERAATMAACDAAPVKGILVGASCRPGLAERAEEARVELFIYPE